jgi:hypothetical protein
MATNDSLTAAYLKINRSGSFSCKGSLICGIFKTEQVNNE